jgi:di/tricarboxylate transporter
MMIAFVLGLLVVGIILLSLEIVSVDLVTLMLLIALTLGGVLSPQEAFAGLASDVVVILASIYVITGALQQTGILAGLGDALWRLSAGHVRRLALMLAGATAMVSTVTNNTTATAVFLQPALEAGRQARISPSKLLLPLAYGSILGGTCTLIGTSTNVAVSGAIVALGGLEPLRLFELTPVGVVLLAVGLAYLSTIGLWLLPENIDDGLTDAYEVREYLTEVSLAPDSPLAGQLVFESDLARLGYRVVQVERGGEEFLPDADTRMQVGDLLVVQASVDQLARVRDATGLAIKPDLRVGDQDLQGGELLLAEAIVAPKSDLIGRTLEEVRFRQRFGVAALAIHRRDRTLPPKLGRVRLRTGDLLLVHGPRERVAALLRDPNLWVLEPAGGTRRYPPRGRGVYVVGFLALALAAGGSGVVPLSIALLLAAVATVLTGAITTEEAYRVIEWRLLILIGGMTAFGTAMLKSGAAAFLAQGIVAALGDFGSLAVLGGFALLTVALTQPMSNAAAALVVLPVAMQAAAQLDANPRSFAVGIALAASVSLATPLEPSCLIVYGPGRYRFIDFIRVGGPLTCILLAVLLLLIPVFWPL